MAPAPGFLEGLRAIAEREGALLLFDEVISGFRLAKGGAQELYGMRPEHCLLDGGAGFPADVVVVEPTGADTQLYCRFNGQELTSLARDRVSCRAGDRISLKPDLARAHLFDADSGVRLVA